MLTRRGLTAWRQRSSQLLRATPAGSDSMSDRADTPSTTSRGLHVLVAPRASRRPLAFGTHHHRPTAASCITDQARNHYSAANDRDDDDYEGDHGDRQSAEEGGGNEYLEMLHHAAGDANGWRAALEIVDEIKAANGEGLTVDVATSLIEVLGARKRFVECLDVLRYSRDQGVRPRIHAYSSAIACCYNEKKFIQALKVFEVMRNDGYVPKNVTYSRALSAALKSDQHELVLEIFDDMLRNKVDTTIVIYNNILNSCARVGDGHSAVGVLRAIRQRDLEMTQSTYHSLAICAGKTGRCDLALEVLESLKNDGFAPTMTIYNSVISACAKGKRWKQVVSVYNEMNDDMKAQLRGLYLGAVIMAHAKSDDQELKLKAIAIFDARKARDEDLNFFAHNAALTALLESNQLEKVHQFASAMKQDGFKWDTLTYQNVLLAYIRGGAIDTAVHMLHSNAKKMEKSTECYRELIQYYAEKGKNPREACRLTMQMMQNNARLSRLDWHNALTHALMLPDRALYWNFRKWMKIRAAGIVHEVPKHLMLPDNAQKQKKQKEQKLL